MTIDELKSKEDDMTKQMEALESMDDTQLKKLQA